MLIALNYLEQLHIHRSTLSLSNYENTGRVSLCLEAKLGPLGPSSYIMTQNGTNFLNMQHQ